MQVIKKLLALLTPIERKHFYLQLAIVLTMALLDTVGVASIMPFMAVLANPDIIQNNVMLNTLYQAASKHFGIGATEQFLYFLGVLVFFLLLISLAFKALATYTQLHFTLMREYSIGRRLVEGYLHQPYSWFLSRHSADLGKTILSEVGAVIGGGLIPMMTLIAQSAVVIAILTLLILIDPTLAFIVGLTLVTAYALIFKIIQRLLDRLGVERLTANEARFKAVSEAFAASKEVKFGGLEQVYIERFSYPARAFAKHQATVQVIGQLPRYALEAIAFGGMLLMVLYLKAQSGSFTSALPVIALYAFAGYRLMPSMQQIYSAATQLRFAGPALDVLHADLTSLQCAQHNTSQEDILLKHAIALNQIRFQYPQAQHPALKNLSLTIPAKSTVGLVGATGSGKTTAVDLILGLLEAQEGTLEVDGKAITAHNRRSWQRVIGYVPQQIYLTDGTVAANIAFGLDGKDIDQGALERAAKIANLHDFVVNELPQQYQTTVGERGVRLSGGQRQRIGIARALYHNPQVLILDEATSALDNLTEQAVMEAVHNLEHEITIVLIAHRLSTVKACDIVFLLEKGEVKGQGTFDELKRDSPQFKAMAGAY